MSDNAILSAPHAHLMGVEFEHFDKDRKEITLRFRAPDSFITRAAACRADWLPVSSTR